MVQSVFFVKFTSGNNRIVVAAASTAGNTEAGTLSKLFIMLKAREETVALLTTQVTRLASAFNKPQASHILQAPVLRRTSLYTEMGKFNERAKRRDSVIFNGTKAKSNSEL